MIARRGFISGVAASVSLGSAGLGRDPVRPAVRARGDAAQAVTFYWLGNAGWRVDIGTRTLLIDPYLSRFPTGLFSGEFDPATRLQVDADVIDQHVGQPDLVLVTHSHWDHFSDVPYISHSSSARIIGTMTTCNLALAYGVPSSLVSPVKGGEVLDFGDYVVEVVAALHGRNAAYSFGFPGVRISQPAKPETVADLPEGGTLAYQVSVKGGPSVFFMGSSDFAARDLAGRAPDIAMAGIPPSDATFGYTSRLLTALGRPGTVIPVHWDNFEVPLVNPPTADRVVKPHLDDFIATVPRISPRTKIIIPEYLAPYSFT